jgi:hypothetical protein
MDTSFETKKKPFPKLTLPIENGFVKSFDVNNLGNFDHDELLEFYIKYGFVVFDNVLTNEEVDLTIKDLWIDINQYLQNFDEDIYVDETNCEELSYASYTNKYGFVNSGPINQLQCWKNRQNQKVYNAFKTLYNLTSSVDPCEQLIACLDRGSILRPTNINASWETKPIYHFDIDPWEFTETGPFRAELNTNKKSIIMYDPNNLTYMLSEGNFGKYNGYPKLSGVIALSDTNENSGGFECFAGFHNYIHEWCEDHEYNFDIKNDEYITNNMQKIFMKKGSLLVFTRELPHNVYSNKSDKFRYAQYVRITPLSELNLSQYSLERRKKLIKNLLPKSLDISSPISQELFMI